MKRLGDLLSPGAKAVKQAAQRHPFVAVAVPFSLILILAVLRFPVPEPVVALEGRTEVLMIWPTGSSTVPLGRVSMVGPEAGDPPCLTEAVLAPLSPKASLKFIRSVAAPGKLSIVLEGPWIVTADKFERRLSDGGFFVMDANLASACAGRRVRLPVMGSLVVGDEGLLSETKFLTGTINIYGRSLNDQTMFKAGDFKLIPGSRIGKAPTDFAPRWIGFVDVDLTSDDAGFEVNATTNGSTFDLFVPGATGSAGGGERIAVTPFAQLSGDPVIQRFAGIFAILMAVLSLISSRIVPKS